MGWALSRTRNISLLVRILVTFRNPVQFGKVNIPLGGGGGGIPNVSITEWWFCRISFLEIAVRLYVGFPVILLIPSSTIKQFIYNVFCKQTMLLDALSVGTTTNFLCTSGNAAATSGSSNTDSCRRDMVLLSTETRLFTKDITVLTHSDRVSTSTSSFLAQRRAYSSTDSKIDLEFCFQVQTWVPCI